jgi:hypothetical protein
MRVVRSAARPLPMAGARRALSERLLKQARLCMLPGMGAKPDATPHSCLEEARP